MTSGAENARVWIDKQTPKAFRALLAVAGEVRAAAVAAGIDRRLIELVNLRVSQINGCAYCLDVHERAALAAGATAQELAVLPGWRRGGPYSALDRAVLGLAEATATLPDEHVLAREYASARAVERGPDRGGRVGGDHHRRLQPGVDPQRPSGAPRGRRSRQP